MIDLIEEAAIPIAMVGLLYALPNTQLTRRLAKEGRLHVGHDALAPRARAINAPPASISRPSGRGWKSCATTAECSTKVYEPEAYCGRLERLSSLLDCSGRRKELPEGDIRRQIEHRQGRA